MRFCQSCCLSKPQKILSGKKPFKCGDCEKAFSQSPCLPLHCRVHPGEKPCSCGTCGKAFSQGTNQKSVGGFTVEKSLLSAVCAVKPSICGVCSKAFGFSAHPSTPENSHPGEPHYQDCHKAFHSLSALSKHQQLHSCKVTSSTAQSHLVTAESPTSETFL